jgi:hypothetical protein
MAPPPAPSPDPYMQPMPVMVPTQQLAPQPMPQQFVANPPQQLQLPQVPPQPAPAVAPVEMAPQQPPAPAFAPALQPVVETTGFEANLQGEPGLPPELEMPDTGMGEASGMSVEEVRSSLPMFRPRFEGAFHMGAPPSVFVADLRSELGVMLQPLAQQLSVDNVTEALLGMPDGARSPLVTERGQQWLHDVLTEARR